MDDRERLLADMDPTNRFRDRAEDYRRHRPGYPVAAIDAVLARLDPGRLIAADIGAGTGIASRLLAARGVTILAVEPNAEMRAAAEPVERVQWLDGVAEATGLATAAVGLVLCAQSFHWFRPTPALEEFHRILMPRGRLALLWNSRDRQDPFTVGYIDAIHQVNGEHPAEMRPWDPALVPRSQRFSEVTLESFPNQQRVDQAGLIGRAISASYVPKAGPAFERLKTLLGELWERHRDAEGLVTMRYQTMVARAERLD